VRCLLYAALHIVRCLLAAALHIVMLDCCGSALVTSLDKDDSGRSATRAPEVGVFSKRSDHAHAASKRGLMAMSPPTDAPTSYIRVGLLNRDAKMSI
jgi:hypothetical protein